MLHFPGWKIAIVLLVCLGGLLLAMPNFLKPETASYPDWLPSRTVNLGLDLQGGSHLLLEVDREAYFREQMENLVDEVRIHLRKERTGYQSLGVRSFGDGEVGVGFSLRNPSEAETIQVLLSEELGRQMQVEHQGSGQFAVTYTPQYKRERTTQLLEQSIEIVRRRVDETGTREPTIARQGDDRILLQVPGLDDPERLKRLLGKTAKMTFHLVDTRVDAMAMRRSKAPAGTMILPSQKKDPEGNPMQYHAVKRKVMLSGDLLVDAAATFERGQPVVSFRFNTQGARKFGTVTEQNVGTPFAIVLDGEVITAPVIREPILGGSGIISGNFTTQSANDLALLLRAGALPAPLKVLEERTVGPSLGQDSIDAGKTAALLGIILVVVFMLLAYGLFGLLADAALLLNMVLILAALSLFQATLTLPGIAGIVLTIGMAVDANVLIFERIREELRVGKTALAALDNGFRRAYQTIIDSNLTTLIVALLLYYFGSGTVKGFAVTLSIGILTSMFTAIMLTRMFVSLWVRRARPKALPI